MNLLRHAPPQRWGRHIRYGLAMLGPVGIAGAQFTLNLELLHAVPNAVFGSFAFLMVASNFGLGICSALFCAPLPKLLADSDADARQAVLRSLFAANVIAAVLAFLVFAGLSLALRLAAVEALLFAGFGALMQIRWFARAHAYALDMQLRSVSSDIVYGALLLAACGVMLAARRISFSTASFALGASALFSLLPFGSSYLKAQFLRFSPAAASGYRTIWQAHSRWSLTGVLTTEATANAHAYIVTAFAGPSEFARIAASSLLIRPIAIAMNALGEYERPRLARELGGMTRQGVRGALRFFRLALAGAWAVTAIASLALILYAPRLMFPERYSIADMLLGCCLWLGIAGIRLMRMPESTLVQAAGKFRPLAFASVWSCGLSVAAVGVFLAAGGPVWSIAGLGLGEAVMAVLIWKVAAPLKR